MKQLSNKLFRGPRPTSMRELDKLKESGITILLNLQSGFYEEVHDDDYEKEAELMGFQVLSIHCSDWMWPKPWQVEKFHRILKLEGKIYMHCLHGVDRTGFFSAVYRMTVQGWSYAHAKAEMFAEGFHKWPYLYWLPALKRYSKS